MKTRFAALFLALLIAAMLLPVSAQAMSITLSHTLEYAVSDMGVDIDDFSDPAYQTVTPLWTKDGILQIADQGYCSVVCLGCEMVLREGVWRFPESVSVSASNFTNGYWFSLYRSDDSEEWYYENDQLILAKVSTLDGGCVTYQPTDNSIEAQYVDGNSIITAMFTLQDELESYYVEYFTTDYVAIVYYTADNTLRSFYVIDRETDDQYTYGGSKGWFIYDESVSGNVSCNAPEGFESLTVSDIPEEYPPLEIGKERKLSGNNFSLSGSTLGSYTFSLGDMLKLSDGSTVRTLKFRINASDALLVDSAGIVLRNGSVVELLILEGDASAFNPAWIRLDQTSGVEEVQLPSGQTMTYEAFLDMLN